MSAAVRFEEPPSESNAVHDWVAIASALKKRPNRWAIVAVCKNAPLAASTARYVRQSGYEALRLAGKFEAVARTVDGEYRVYARWVGEPS